jgi:hypothetical protein
MTKASAALKKFHDEQVIREAAMRKRQEEKQKDMFIESLKGKGKIEEAAAVFSYEGMRFMFETMGEIVARRMEPMIDQKITEMLQGMQTGMLQAITEATETKIENSIHFGTSVEGNEEAAATDIDLHRYTDFSMMDGMHKFVEEEIKEVPPEVQPEVQSRTGKQFLINELFERTYTGVEIPRNHKGIHWSKIKDEDQRQIILFYISLAADNDLIATSGKFKKSHPDAMGVYQRMIRVEGKGAWNRFKQEYLDKYAPAE